MIRFIDLKKCLLIHLLAFFLPCHATYAALQGNLFGVDCESISGLAWDDANPDSRVQVNIYDVTTRKPILLTTVTSQDATGDGVYQFSFALPAGIRNGVPHKFSAQFAGTTTELSGSPQSTIFACYRKLNDTGRQKCADGASNDLNCPVSGYRGQDGDYGRDARAPGPYRHSN